MSCAACRSTARRQMAIVFQEYSRSLLPWMTTPQRAFPLRRKGLDKAEAPQLVEHAVEAVGLDGSSTAIRGNCPAGCSSAWRSPGRWPTSRVLLMDEPFASVDAQTRADLEDLILAGAERYGVTVLFVTHDIDESVYLGRGSWCSRLRRRARGAVEVDLPGPRDQVETKELPEFARLRGHVWRSIKRRDGASRGLLRPLLDPEYLEALAGAIVRKRRGGARASRW